DRRVARLVDRVVDLAAESVERGDGAAPLRRQEQERVVEARTALRRLLLAVLVGSHRIESARESISGQSQARSTGRCLNTSPLARSIFCRMRRPPWTTVRISRPILPGSARSAPWSREIG